MLACTHQVSQDVVVSPAVLPQDHHLEREGEGERGRERERGKREGEGEGERGRGRGGKRK